MSSSGQQTGFPQLDSALVDTERRIVPEWYRFFVALWQIGTGSGQIPVFQAIFLKEVSPGEIEAYNTSLKALVGTLRLKDQPGANPVAQTLVTSPFSFTSPGDGTFAAFCCEIDLARGATSQKISLTGGAVPLMKDDVVTLKWTGVLPTATWFPSG